MLQLAAAWVLTGTELLDRATVTIDVGRIVDVKRGVATGAAPLDGWLAPDGVVLLELNRRQYRPAADTARRVGWRASPRHASDGQTTTLVLRPT